MERAKDRMGGPAEVTRELQRAVPLMERVLLAKLPVPRVLERWESRRLENPGRQNLNHWRGAMLVALGVVLTWMVLGVEAPISRAGVIAWFETEDGHRAWFMMMFFILWVMAGVLLPMLSIDFLEKAACETVNMKRLGAVSALTLMCEALCVWLIFSQVMGRQPSPVDILNTLFAGITVLAILYLMARWVSGRREPYVQWTSLRIAD
jgi:hypothetical protein